MCRLPATGGVGLLCDSYEPHIGCEVAEERELESKQTDFAFLQTPVHQLESLAKLY